MIKALFFDIDGTLVSFKTHEIPVSTIEALTAAKAKGIHIFISTGRPRVIINNLSALQERNLIDGYITMNGAYCFVEDTVIYKSPIPTAEVDALTAFCHERNIPCILVGEHDICVNQPGEVVEEIFHRQLKVDPIEAKPYTDSHADKAFDKGDFGTFLDEFFKAIHSRYDIEKPNVQRLIRRKLNIINRLKEENRALKQAALEKEKALVKYAREYILMGDECLKHDMKEAAMKNYEKAVTLCPKFKEAWKKIKKLEKEMLKR